MNYPHTDEEWLALHRRNFESLDPELRAAAVAALREQFRARHDGGDPPAGMPPDENRTVADCLRFVIAQDPVHWAAPYHFFWGMTTRNWLREHGFGEKEFGIDNLDDYYVPLIEAAVAAPEGSDDALRGSDSGVGGPVTG